MARSTRSSATIAIARIACAFSRDGARPMSRKALGAVTMLAIGVLLLAGAGTWLLHRRMADRPRYIFVNETGSHDHDLAFEMSLKLGEKRSGIENALVLLPRLPPGQTIE